jgi:catechol 2,3-dioxygenase-like lactoylglutathione lyase family enzyme
MPLIRRLDHVILCGRDRQEWVPLIERVLDLHPRRAREGDEWGFSNAEFDIGDGFLGLVEPAGEDSQLHRFLARHPEGFYAMSIDVGDLAGAAERLDAGEVPYRKAMRDGQVSLLWVPPQATGGVLYQLTSGMSVGQGTNPLYLGVSSVMVAVGDLDAAYESYRRCFGFEEAVSSVDERLGCQLLELAIPGAALGDTIVLAAPLNDDGPVADQLRQQGPGIFEFSITVRDLPAELVRLGSADIALTVGSPPEAPSRAWIDPSALRGVRVELRAAPDS